MADVGPEVKPGVTTSEHAMATTANWWTTLVAVAGGLGLVIPSIIDALQPVAQTKTGMIVLQVLSGALVVIGIITKGVVSANYSHGRSMVKAAAARDVPPPPAV